MISRFTTIIRINRSQRFFYYALNQFRNYSYLKNCNILAPSIPFYLSALWGIKKKNDTDKSLTAKEIILAKADALFEQGEYKEIYKLLNSYKNNNDVEILWRLSRALYKISKLELNDSDAKKLIYEAYALISQALHIQEDHWAVQKWCAILLNTKTSYEGTKIKIKELYNVKLHMLRAFELNPTDATTLYMIGNWCYQVANLTWYQRKIASTLFCEPPTSTFEEALKYFKEAEKVDPFFYGQNLLMIGKTYLKLNENEKAQKYLKLALEYSAKNDDDQEAKQEALKILNNL